MGRPATLALPALPAPAPSSPRMASRCPCARSACAGASLDSFVRSLEEKGLPAWTNDWTPVRSTIHGDLHGGNLLIDLRGTPWVIDYGEVGEGLPIFDVVRILVSVLFE